MIDLNEKALLFKRISQDMIELIEIKMRYISNYLGKEGIAQSSVLLLLLEYNNIRIIFDKKIIECNNFLENYN